MIVSLETATIIKNIWRRNTKRILCSLLKSTHSRSTVVLLTQRCKNVPMCQQYWCKKNPISGKNLCKILRCFVEKVSNVAISRFLVAFFLAYFGTLCNFFCIFLHYLSLLGLLRCFVANSICRNLRTFSGKIILAQTLFV